MPHMGRYSILFLLVLSMISCKPAPTPEVRLDQPTPGAVDDTHAPAASSIPAQPTNTPLPPTPTNTALPPTQTATPLPPRLNKLGPYVLFIGRSGIWISNPDGSYVAQLAPYEVPSTLDAHRLVSPTGDRIAQVVSNAAGLDLVILSIPNGEQISVVHLIDSPPPELFDAISPNAFATYAIRDFDSIAWQPGEGKLLAFIGAMNGPTADLYLLDTETGEITQLTDGPSQAILPEWSPDGQYIVQYGVRWTPPFGGAILGPTQMDGIWAVRVSDGKVITLPKPEGIVPHFVGWRDVSHFITFDPGDCYSKNLRSVDITNGKSTLIMDNTFYYEVALSPENGALLFSSKAECASSLGEGVYLVHPGETPVKLIDQRAWEISWLPESHVFDAYPVALFSADGATRYDPPVYDASYNPSISLAGYQAWKVIQDQKSRLEVLIPGGDWQTIINEKVDDLIWDPVEGTTLFITTEDGRLFTASYPDFTPTQIANLGGSTHHVLWVP